MIVFRHAEGISHGLIGMSDRMAGPKLPSLISRMTHKDPQLMIGTHIDSS